MAARKLPGKSCPVFSHFPSQNAVMQMGKRDRTDTPDLTALTVGASHDLLSAAAARLGLLGGYSLPRLMIITCSSLSFANYNERDR